MVLNFSKLLSYDCIYVIGHKKPDLDSIVSSKVLSEILNHYNVNSKYAIFENDCLDETDKKMLEDCMNYKPVIIKENEINNKHFFLVDHNDLKQSVKDINLVVGSIDHHIDSGIKLTENYILTDFCACALSIYNIFRDFYNFSYEQKKQIFYAFLRDSIFGKGSRYKESDKEVVKALGFTDKYEELFKKYFIPTDLSSNIEYIFYNNGSKTFDFGKIKFKSAYIQRYDIDKLENYKNFIKNLNENFLGIWIDFYKSKTYTFLKYNNSFNEKIYDYITSRAGTIIKDTLEYIEMEDL